MEDERKIILLDVNDILPNRFQPRIKFREDSLNELSESIKKYGVIEPIVVRPIGDKYEIIAGERRYKACLLAEKTKVPAIVTSLDDKDSAEVALIENVQREDLTPIEEAVSYKKILEMGYMTQEELASKLGKNQGTVANKLRLLNLTEEVQEALLESKISERHARSLLKLKNNNDQIEMLNKIISNRLTVRKTDEEIEKVLQRKGDDKMGEFNPFASNDEVKPIPEFNAFASTEEEPVQTETMNPGFMDVNKIEETAEDINIEKPQADISSLLTPTELPQVEEEKPVEQVEEKVEQPEIPNIEQQSKFFTMPVMEDKQDEIGKSDEDAFTSNLNAFESSPAPFNFNFTPIESTPVVNEEKTQILEEEPTIIPLAEEKVEEPKVEELVTPVVEVPTIDEIKVEDVPQVEEEKPVEQVEIPEFNFAELLKDIGPTSNDVQPTVSVEDTSIPELQQNDVLEVQPQKNLMQALDLVRNCGKQLEELGFKVNLDEIDLSNTYQVTFNIEK